MLDTLDAVEMGTNELAEAHEYAQSNRSLYLKLAAVLLVFLIIFIVFFV